LKARVARISISRGLVYGQHSSLKGRKKLFRGEGEKESVSQAPKETTEKVKTKKQLEVRDQEAGGAELRGKRSPAGAKKEEKNKEEQKATSRSKARDRRKGSARYPRKKRAEALGGDRKREGRKTRKNSSSKSQEAGERGNQLHGVDHLWNVEGKKKKSSRYENGPSA